jgi:hypothetical protein
MPPESSLASLDPISGFTAWAAFTVAVLAIAAAILTIAVLKTKKIQLEQLKDQLQKETNAACTAEEAAERMKLERVPRAERNRAFADVKTRQTRQNALETLVAIKAQQFSDDKPRYRKKALALLAIGAASFVVEFLIIVLQQRP